ncbi:MAG: S8 family serine peptidase [Planctomycetota bacterium]
MSPRPLLRRRGRTSFRSHFLTESLESRLLLAATAGPLSPGVSGHSGYVPGEVLVQWKPDFQTQFFPSGPQSLSLPGNVVETIETPLMRSLGAGRIERLRLSAGQSVEAAVAALQADPRVSVVEPNWIYQSMAVSDDPQYTSGGLWGMYSSDSPVSAGPTGTTNEWGSQAEQVWNNGVTGSSSVIVGVIDQGIQTTHPDLRNNIWVNPFETPGDGIDNDGNGYIDDIHGWDFVNNDNSVYDGPIDSHGTHVAGTIGAEGGNGLGVAGVSWDVSMISLKFMGSSGGTTANAIRAIDYLTNLKIRHGLNIVASNNSWGGGVYSRLLHEAIIRGANQDILFVAAAGNATSNNDAVASYPANYNTLERTAAMAAASYDAVISVAAITSTGTLASFSNFGATKVDLAAPGEGIISTVPDGYGSRNGTSMAAPHVTGAIALLAAAMPGRVPAALIRSALLSGATPTPSLAGKTATGGRLNVPETLRRSTNIELDRDIYGPAQTITITVTSAGGNANSQVRDTLTVRVQSTTETAGLDVTLTETGNATGIFQGTLGLSAGPAVSDNLLQVSHGDQVTASLPQLSVSDTALIDALPPTISGISISSTGSTAALAWNTSEPASATIRFGRSAEALDRAVSIAAPALSRSTILHALDAAAGYFCQIEVTDLSGNTRLSDVRTFSTQLAAPILFIDDDQNASHEIHFRSALNANALAFDEWNVFSGSRLPAAANLSNYPLVIWNTGSDFEAPDAGLSPAEQSAIAAYLSAGGRIYVSGQDILYNGVSADFRQNFLKIASYVDDAIDGAHTETGVPGSQITSGLALPISVPGGYPFLLVDAVEPVPGAQGLLFHNQSSVTPVWTGISYHGNYAAGGFGMVFSSLPFESISATDPQPNNQAEFLRRIVAFLNADIAPGFIIPAADGAVTTEAGGSSSFSIVLTSQPSHSVTIPLSVSASSEGFVSTNSVSFSPDNWNIPQTITVTGVDDWVDDGDRPWQVITGPAVSTDPQYNGLNPADASFMNVDDDTAGISISALSGSFTTESGASVSFTVRLTSQPLAPVTIAVSSTDTTEGRVSQSALVFSPADWNQLQTVVVTGVDDAIRDGNIGYGITIGSAVSSDPLYHGRDPSDFSLLNLDDDPLPPTKFFAVDDGPVDRMFEYDRGGELIEDYPIGIENTASRGVAVTAAADRLWVVDASRRVSVLDTSGNLLGSWTASFPYSVSDVQGIATDGTHIWILDRLSDRVYYYLNGASRLSGSQTATTSWLVNFRNADATDMVFGSQGGQQYLWIVNDSSADRVYRYTLTASGGTSGFISWPLDSTNSSPTGITLDPGNGSMDIWIADAGTDRVYRYSDGRTAAAPVLASSFALAAGNINVQGLADPPPPATESALDGYETAVPADDAVPVGPAFLPQRLRLSSPDGQPASISPTATQPAERHSLKKSQTRQPAGSGHTFPVNHSNLPVAPAPPRPSVLDLFFTPAELDMLLAAL